MISRNNLLIGIGLFLLALSLSLFINQLVLSTLLEKIIINAISVLVGLSIAIIGIFLGSINTLYLSIFKIVKTKDQEVLSQEEIKKIKKGLSDLVDELKQNALFTLFVFIFILLLFFIKEMDIPYVKWFIESSIITKEFLLNFIIITGNFLIFWAIIDSTHVIFKITKAFELMEE